MKQRLRNLDAVVSALKPYLSQYLAEHGIDTSQPNFKCIDPKHEDTNASMHLYDHSVHCFGCGATYNIHQCCSILEGKPSRGREWIEENVLYLADKYNIQLELEDLTQEEIYEYRTYAAYKLAAELVADREFGDYSTVDKEIDRRNWNKDKLALWGIGTVNYDQFRNRLKKAGFEPGLLDGIGLSDPTLFSETNLIFTVTDEEGRAVGFSAKRLDGGSGPRYTNTRQTGLECAIFKKGERLYGYDVAKEAPDPLYIFEGQANVVTARHQGLMNCCCLMGTALTDHHISLLKRHGSFNIVLIFDGDEAGRIATQKAIDEKFSKEKDFLVKLCQMPEGMDPDELIREKGYDEFVRLKRWTAFEWRMLKFMEQIEGQGDDVEEEKKEEIVEKMIPIIVSEKSYIRQEKMAKQVSKMTGYDLALILSEVKRKRNEKEAEVQSRKLNAMESILGNARRNPEDIDVALVECQMAIDDINKSVQSETESSYTFSSIQAFKEVDEKKTGDFAGFRMDPAGLGNIAARLNEDWKKDTLIYIGGMEQSAKCQHKDTLVTLSNGTQKRIEDVVRDKDTRVIGRDKNNKLVPIEVSNWIDSGIKECFQTDLETGISIKSTDTHKYFTLLDGWKKLSELQLGDKIAIARNYSCFDTIKSPISEEEAVLLGAFLSDGSITDSIGFSNIDEEIINYFKNIAENKWPGITFSNYDGITNYIIDPTGQKNRAKEWLKNYNLFGKTAHKKFIPDDIFKCSLKRIGKFLGMFWACDGWVSFHPEKKNRFEIGITLCNYKMVKQIRSLLLRFGIKAKISRDKIVKLNGKEFKAHSLSIKDIENAKKFYNNIRIPFTPKQERLKAILDSDKDKIGAYGDNFPKELWPYIKKTAKEKGLTLSSLFVLIGEDKNSYHYDKSKNRYKERAAWRPVANSRKHPGQEWLGITPRKLKLIGYVLQDKFLIDLAEGDLYFDIIKEIKPIGKHQCYDLTTETHNFIAEDILVHNSSILSQMMYEIVNNPKNDAIGLYFSIDDPARRIGYKWVCHAVNDLTLQLNWVSNPNYWAKQEGDIVHKLRDKGYKKVLKLAQEGKLVLKDASDGTSLGYMKNVIRYHRERNPGKNIIVGIDSFHKLSDYGQMQEAQRTKRLSNDLKELSVAEHIATACTAEYKKLQPGVLPDNDALSQAKGLSYDADVIIHLSNDLQMSDEQRAIFIHEYKGQILPRIRAKFGKNKISGYIGLEFLDLFNYSALLRAVDLGQAKEEAEARQQFISENKDKFI